MSAPLSTNRALLKARGCPDITPGAICHGFHVTVLVKTCCCSSTVGHPWRPVGYRELGTPTPVCHLTWSVDKVFGNDQGLRLHVYISYYNSPTFLFIFFFLGFLVFFLVRVGIECKYMRDGISCSDLDV